MTKRAERVYGAVGLALIASGVVHLVVTAFSARGWSGPVSFRKPATFGLSFGLTLLTVVWLLRYLPLRERLAAVLVAVFAADCVVEVGGITLQAWRGVPSHVNRSTPFDSVVASVLAAGGAVLIVTLGLMGLATFRRALAERVAPSLALALRAGFVSLWAGLVTGAAMIGRGVAISNGGDPARAYDELGFLKPVHGVGLHGVLVLPLVALAARCLWRTERQRLQAVRVAVGGYAALLAAALVVSLV